MQGVSFFLTKCYLFYGKINVAILQQSNSFSQSLTALNFTFQDSISNVRKSLELSINNEVFRANNAEGINIFHAAGGCLNA